MLSRDFVTPVLLANAIAFPAAYYAMDRWLQDFAYRVAIDPGTFALGGVLAFAVAWLTVAGQAVRAALANALSALRQE